MNHPLGRYGSAPAGEAADHGAGERGGMETPTLIRGHVASATAVSVVALAAGILWLLIPEIGPFTSGVTPVERVMASDAIGPLAAASLLVAAAAVTAVIGLGELSGALSAPRARASAAAVALLAGAVTLLGLVGFDGLPIAGYTLALLVPIAVVVVVAVLLVRRPLIGAALVLPVVAVAVLAWIGVFPIQAFYLGVAETIVADPVRFFAALGIIALGGLWVLWGARGLARGAGGPGAFVERYRVAITIAAAACALPYAVARASWLTPWPLFGGEYAMIAENPLILVTGILLGLAMLTGGVLTLGLILPWGRRFPSWVPRLGGRSVPVALAVVPASTVAVLFSAAGADLLVQAFTGAMGALTGAWVMALVLPFWLWGPLLALATWGYARHRARSSVAPAPVG